MAQSGEDVALILLRALPAEVSEPLLVQLGGEAAERVRARLRESSGPPTSQELDEALKEFFDLQRIAERAVPAPTPAPAAAAPADADPVKALAALPPAMLARGLAGEPHSAVAMLIGALDAATATEVMKRLSADARPEVALRLAQGGTRNRALIAQLAKAIFEKCQGLTDVPPEPTADERIASLAAMLRALSRADRLVVLEKVEKADPEMATAVRAKLYTFDDLLRLEDRGLQTLLAELDMKTLALALSGADATITKKITTNISSRFRELLTEEMGLIGTAQASSIEEARARIAELLGQFEEQGKINLQ